MNQLQQEEQQAQYQRFLQYQQQQQQYGQPQMQNQQQSIDPWENMMGQFKSHTSALNNQNNNNRTINRNQPTNTYEYPYRDQDSPMKQGYHQNYQSNAQQQIPQQQNYSNNHQQSLSNMTSYQKVFKTLPDGRVVCNFEDVKKYMESETRTEIIPRSGSGIKRIVEIDHKM